MRDRHVDYGSDSQNDMNPKERFKTFLITSIQMLVSYETLHTSHAYIRCCAINSKSSFENLFATKTMIKMITFPILVPFNNFCIHSSLFLFFYLLLTARLSPIVTYSRPFTSAEVHDIYRNSVTLSHWRTDVSIRTNLVILSFWKRKTIA